MGKVMLEGFQCERCKHKWIPRSKDEIPTICPKCKSPYWNKPRKVANKLVSQSFLEDRVKDDVIRE